MPCCTAGAGGCLAPQNTQCSAASGRSLVQLAHFFTGPPWAEYRSAASHPANATRVRFAQGQHVRALRLYDAIVAAAPLDFEARIRVADAALALGDPGAARVYRAVGWYCLRSGHPLSALVCARAGSTS